MFLKMVTLSTLIFLCFGVSLAFSAEGFEYIPDTNTLALWHFNEGGGDKITDSSSNKFNGTVEGKPDWGDEDWNKAGAKGKSFKFDGNTVINVGKIDELKTPDAITVEAWVYPEDLSGWKLICCNWGGAVVGAWHLGVENGMPRFHITNNAGVTVDASGGKLETGKWFHVAGTYDKKAVKIYVDGKLIAEKNADGSLKKNDMDVVIGSKDSREFKWKGRIDEVRISKIAREPKDMSPNLSGPQAVNLLNSLIITWGKVRTN